MHSLIAPKEALPLSKLTVIVSEQQVLEGFIKHYPDHVSILNQFNIADVVASSMYAQAYSHYPNVTDEQDHMFEVMYSQMLSDNILSQSQYMKIYKQYSSMIFSMNVFIGSILSNKVPNHRFTDVTKVSESVYVYGSNS